MTLDKALRIAGVVVALSSAATVKFSMLLAFLLFFAGLILIKFSTAIKITREHELFNFGEKRG